MLSNSKTSNRRCGSVTRPTEERRDNQEVGVISVAYLEKVHDEAVTIRVSGARPRVRFEVNIACYDNCAFLMPEWTLYSIYSVVVAACASLLPPPWIALFPIEVIHHKDEQIRNAIIYGSGRYSQCYMYEGYWCFCRSTIVLNKRNTIIVRIGLREYSWCHIQAACP